MSQSPSINSSKNKFKVSTIIALVGAFLVVAAIVFFIIAINHSETITVGEFPEPTSTHSITCQSSSTAYPFFTEDDSANKDLKITAILVNDRLSSISLSYTLKYSNAKDAEHSREYNHSAMNTAFAKDNLAADSFNAVYSNKSDSTKLNLYAVAKELNGANEKYFLLDGANGNYKTNNIKSILTQKGLKCVEK